MKQERRFRKNKQKLFGAVAATLLIVLTVILPGVQADFESLPTRGNPGMVYDSESDRIVIFGGWNMSTSPSHQDTWIYNYNEDTYAKRTPSPVPRRRAEPGIIYDSLRDMVVIFGGKENTTSTGDRGDTWAYDYNTNTWEQKFPVLSPSARRAHRMVYDSESDRIVLFGGMYQTSTFYNETWIGTPGSNTWQKMNPVLAPPARAFHHMAYDSESDRAIIFGGSTSTGSNSLFDTWAYDYNTNSWENLTNASNHPQARSSHIMAYDSDSDRIVLFGGGNLTSTYDNTWLFDYNTNTWTEMDPATSPPARCRHEAAYDSQSDRVIIYGGTTGPWTTGNVLITTGKTWAYDVNSDSWEMMSQPEPDPDPDPWIPGYNFLFLVGITSIIGIILLKYRSRKG